MRKLDEVFAETLEEIVRRRPTPMEVRSMANQLAETIRSEVGKQVAAELARVDRNAPSSSKP